MIFVILAILLLLLLLAGEFQAVMLVIAAFATLFLASSIYQLRREARDPEYAARMKRLREKEEYARKMKKIERRRKNEYWEHHDMFGNPL